MKDMTNTSGEQGSNGNGTRTPDGVVPAGEAARPNPTQSAGPHGFAANQDRGPAQVKPSLPPKFEAAIDSIASADRHAPSDSTFPHQRPTVSPQQKENTDMNAPNNKDTSKLASDTNQVSDDLAQLAKTAIDSIRKLTDEFAARAGVTKDEAVGAVRNAGYAAANQLGSVAGEARTLTETGLDSLGKQVVRNPLAALAIAAGTGLLLGLMSRSDNRR